MSEAGELKSCCAAAYESNFAHLLLGESFHPGGLNLTARLCQLLALTPGDRVLDVACGRGESAIFVARQFGCAVTGVDFGAETIATAESRAEAARVAHLVRFEVGDAERLAYPDGAFDAILCECAFCTFPDKDAAAREFARILRRGGRLGLSDLTRAAELPAQLTGLAAWIACIADAQPCDAYAAQLERAGFSRISIEPHDGALAAMVREIQTKLLSVELMVKLEKINLLGVDFAEAKKMAACAADAVRSGLLGYSLITAIQPCG